jgi:hypothetical protein
MILPILRKKSIIVSTIPYNTISNFRGIKHPNYKVIQVIFQSVIITENYHQLKLMKQFFCKP